MKKRYKHVWFYGKVPVRGLYKVSFPYSLYFLCHTTLCAIGTQMFDHRVGEDDIECFVFIPSYRWFVEVGYGGEEGSI